VHKIAAPALCYSTIMPRHDLEYVSDIVATAVENRQSRTKLQNGMELRRQMHEAAQQGQPFNHYRTAWLNQCAQILIDRTRELCGEFNAQHTDDEASLLDMLDMLQNAAGYVAMSVQQQQKFGTPNGGAQT